MRILILLGFLFSATCQGGEVFTKFPENIDPAGKYVFYSHGFIVEGSNPKPVNPRWGVYDFPQVKRALSDDGYHLIAYHRPSNTDPSRYAEKLASNVLELIKNGVEPKNISLVGFSRGGAITILTSNLLARDDLNYIILAGCGDYIDNDQDLKMYGDVFSVLETSDELVGSCQNLITRSANVKSFNELSVSTGKEHGAFYTPLREWVKPVKKWIKRNEG